MLLKVSLMKKTTTLIICILTATQITIGLNLVNAEDNNINIVCTNSILADFTKNLLPENITVSYIMPPGACPAHFDPSPKDIQLVTNADIIISLGWEQWLQTLLEYNPTCTQITCQGLGEWNIPAGAKTYVEHIATELSTILPDYNETITEKKIAYLNQINSTAEELKNLISTKGYTGRKVVCMMWQKEFIQWLGLNVTYAYKPPERMSTQDILNVTQALQKKGVCAIIDNLQSGVEFGSKLASEAGVSHIVLTNFPGAVPGTNSYLEMIRYNVNQTINGIALFDYKQGEIQGLEKTINSLEMQRNLFLAITLMFMILSIVLGVMYKRK
ncbi:MAG TPA: zinc ABC transporter substrate-binding protein [Thermoplasmatales archaeon]|nr:zinc ABC transporter substrate-binding protein [Thermoplasmatales archaeon]